MKARVLTISDGVAEGTRPDRSGEVAATMLHDAGFETDRVVVADDADAIAGSLRSAIASQIELVVTTGGTGFGPRDVTPEATRVVIEREAPGLAELMRAEGLKHTPMAALSRGIAGIAGASLVVNLPGSPTGVQENLTALLPVLPHTLKLLSGDTEH